MNDKIKVINFTINKVILEHDDKDEVLKYLSFAYNSALKLDPTIRVIIEDKVLTITQAIDFLDRVDIPC